jgi:hypothetical protein
MSVADIPLVLSVAEAVARGLVGFEESARQVTDEDGVAGALEQHSPACF